MLLSSFILGIYCVLYPGQGQTSENIMVSSKLNSTYIPKPAKIKLTHLPETGEEQNKKC